MKTQLKTYLLCGACTFGTMVNASEDIPTPLSSLTSEVALYTSSSIETQAELAETVIKDLDTGKKYDFTEGLIKIEEVEGDISKTLPHWPALSLPERSTSSMATDFPDLIRDNGEKVLMKVLEGFDGRSPVKKPQDTIHRVQAQLWLKFSDGQYGGSGTLVGPNHIITAGHNVFDPTKQEWVENISVRLSLYGINIPFNEQKVVRIYTYNKWTEKNDSNHDIALLVLNENIGQRVGWYGMDCLPQPPCDLKITVTGYPMEVREGKSKYIENETKSPADRFKTMWTMSSNPDQMGLFIAELIIKYTIDTSPGQSGSGIWYQTKDGCFVIGVHTYGNQTENSGTRITQKRLKDICSWISQTYNVQPMQEKVEQPKPRELDSATQRLVAEKKSSDSVIGAHTKGNARLKVGGSVKTEGATGTTKGIVSSGRSQMSVEGGVDTRGSQQTVGAELDDESDVTIGGELVTNGK